MAVWTKDVISPQEAKTLHGLFMARVARQPNNIAYRYFCLKTKQWQQYTWSESLDQVRIWRSALRTSGLSPGQSVGLMLRNCPEWIFLEQACNAEGLISVPLYPNDRPDNVSYIINEAEIKLLLIENEAQVKILIQAEPDISENLQVIHLEDIQSELNRLPSMLAINWLKLAENTSDNDQESTSEPEALTTIVYTSGTTGKPKGVMLSHKNILSNAYAGISAVDVYQEDLFLSFLPLSHTLERTVGYYIPMMTGATVAFCRSVPKLAEDLVDIKPTVIIAVPRIYERVYGKVLAQLEDKSAIARYLFSLTEKVGWKRFLHQQGRGNISPDILLWPILQKLVAQKILDRLGGRLRFSISGGAPLPLTVAHGLTETSPVISVNTPQSNIPESIGKPLPGVEVRLDKNHELQSRSDCVMLGYWKNPEATTEIFTEDGWIRTGDLAKIIDDHIYITGRLKEILVLSNGEKVPPVDMEIAICLDPLFEQAMVIGEGKPYLSAILVLDPMQWKKFAHSLGVSTHESALKEPIVKAKILEKVASCVCEFPGYAHIRQITLSLDTWTDSNFCLTASLKLRRAIIMEKFKSEIEEMYSGH